MSDIPSPISPEPEEIFPADEAKVHADITALREKIETLMNDRIAPAVVSAAQRAEASAHRVTDRIADRAEELSALVRQRPLTAIAAAAFAGYVFAIIRRR